MRLRLGINDCFAVKRWPLAGDIVPIVRDGLGLTLLQHSFDLVPAGVPASDAATLATTARAAGVEPHSTFTGLAAYSDNMLLHPDPLVRSTAESWYRGAIAYTAALGARATGGHLGAFSVPDWEDADRRRARWDELQACLERLAAEARGAGLEYLLVENLAAAREPSTMSMIEELLTDGDAERVPVRLCLDVGHMCVAGTSGADRDPYAWLRRFGPSAPVVQLQQSDAEGDHHWPFTAAYNAAGRIEADRVIDALGEGGTEDAALVLEIIPPFEQEEGSVLEDLRVSVEYWREALVRRGVLAV